MKPKTIKEKVLAAAGRNIESDKILRDLFPQWFASTEKPIFVTSDGVNVYNGDSYFTVYQKEAFVEEGVATNKAIYGSDWNHIKFKYKKNAEKYAQENNAIRFTILEIEHACFHSKISKSDTKKLLTFFKNKIKFEKENKLKQ